MDGRRDIARTARVIRDCDADIACLQELDDLLPRSGFRYQPREIAAATGLRLIFHRTIDLRLAGYGIAIGSRFPVEEIRHHALPSRGEPRGCIEVRLAPPSGRLHVLCTHLGLSAEERILQVDFVASRIRDLTGPILLAGDFNEPPSGAAILQLTAESRLLDCWPNGPPTYPADNPVSRIDYVFHSAGINIANAECIDTLASDHLPIAVDFEIVS